MINPEMLLELKKLIVDECKDDHVGLWSVLWEARRLFPDASSELMREITIDVIRSLLVEGRIVAGFPGKDGRSFNAWDLSSEEAVQNIEEEWIALGRDPNIGEIVWVTAPDDEGAQNGPKPPSEAPIEEY